VKLAILGAGALGCVLGGFIAEAGYDVILIGRRKSHIDAINQKGLVITGFCGRHVVKVLATYNPLEVKDAEFLILTIKTMETAEALESVKHLYKNVNSVLSLQNGMEKDEQLTKRFGLNKVIGGTTMVGGALLGDGHVEYALEGVTFLGELDGRKTERIESIAKIFNDAGLKTEIVDDIRAAEWTKLTLAVAFMALSSLTRVENQKVMRSPSLARLFVQLVKECASVAAKEGVQVKKYAGMEIIKGVADANFETAVELVVKAGIELEKAGKTGFKSSMLQTILSGRKTEVEGTIGYVLKKARELNVDVPGVTFCYMAIRGINDYLK
jgi:2-dehydropantoate 2-reductase